MSPEDPPKEMRLPENMLCSMCDVFKWCQKYLDREGNEPLCDWNPSRFKEKEWSCYTLSWGDILEVAERNDLSLDSVDMEEVIASIKKGTECALVNRDEIIRDAIENASVEPSCREIQKSELRAMGGGDPYV